MDKKITKTPHWKKWLWWGTPSITLLAGLVYAAWSQANVPTLQVTPAKLSWATVTQGNFQEYLALEGIVQPLQSVSLDLVEGGRVEQRLIEAGATITAGQTILTLSNPDLQREYLSRQEQYLLEKNSLASAELAQEEKKIAARMTLLDLENQLSIAAHKLYSDSVHFSQHLIPLHEYKATQSNYKFLLNKKQLTADKLVQEQRTLSAEIEQKRAYLQLKTQNLSLAQAALTSLQVQAPVSGLLSELTAEVGELKTKGTTIGKIDITNGFLLRASVDEFYLARVAVGQKAQAEIQNQNYTLKVKRIFPKVSGGRFQIDLEFTDTMPTGIQTGQTIATRLTLGNNTQALLLPRGDFYNLTGGNWVFIKAKDGKSAIRKNIRIGRQNPDAFEVLSGLLPQDTVLISGYHAFLAYERLTFQ